MGKETSKIALNAHVHLRTANQQMSRPERHVDDITDMRRSCWLRENTSGRRPLGSSSRLLKVPNVSGHQMAVYVWNVGQFVKRELADMSTDILVDSVAAYVDK